MKTMTEAEKAALRTKLEAEDKISVANNRASLLLQREQDGQVSVQCGKCGTESLLDAKRPAKPAAKCGVCGGALEGAPHAAPRE